MSWETAIALLPSGGDCRPAGRLRYGAAHGLRRRLHRLDDVHVARAAAKVAFQAPANLVFGWVWILLQEVGRGHDEARRAVAALQAMLVPKSLLQGVQLTVRGHALDRGELLAFGLDGEHGAALDGFSVHQDGASAALAGVAADVSPGEADYVSQVVHEQQPGLNLVLLPVTVDCGRDLVFHTLLLLNDLPRCATWRRENWRADSVDQTISRVGCMAGQSPTPTTNRRRTPLFRYFYRRNATRKILHPPRATPARVCLPSGRQHRGGL